MVRRRACCCKGLPQVSGWNVHADRDYTKGLPEYNFVMGVEFGMPADPDLLSILLKIKNKGAPWQATVIGRSEIWPVHQRVAELGGHLRTGLEDRIRSICQMGPRRIRTGR